MIYIFLKFVCVFVGKFCQLSDLNASENDKKMIKFNFLQFETLS